ncbi:hypothetical protein CGLO_17775 [Colletotrichum gloeosporioides Cg-14]|nr:hypothetical protein CGLO_17775 [Colletotrichum gloeosporioides Cg-14]
MAQTFP